MPGETEERPSGWTTDTLRFLMDERRQWQERFDTERDRRLTEVAVEREKALKIKEESDKTALELARQINDLHLANLNGEQARLLADRERFISRESYDISQKDFAVWRDQVNAALSLGTGRDRGVALSWAVLVGAIAVTATLVTLVVKLL
jgi:hypothetical protein